LHFNVAIHIHSGDYAPLSIVSRWFGSEDPYNAEDCRMHSGLAPRNNIAFNCFGVNANQRYFLRRIQKMEKVDTPPEILAHHYCHLGHFLLQSRNFLSAVQYYLRARKVYPDDPVINLCLGVSYIQTSTQKTQSRPDHILKAFAYFKHYQRVRGDCAESNYNIGRALHHLGLNHLAIRYYEKALRNPSEKYDRVVAYNLSLLYMNSGSPQLAQRILYDHSKW
jgi:tetratricopeptide (TPR) repeat protein